MATPANRISDVQNQLQRLPAGLALSVQVGGQIYNSTVLNHHPDSAKPISPEHREQVVWTYFLKVAD